MLTTSRACIIRLSRYKNALYRFKELGFVKVFSDNLAEAIGVNPPQVRKDFSLFGIAGNKKGGYIIDNLLDQLNTILGKTETHKVVLIGAGNMGTALMRYKGFDKENIKIVAVFEIDPSKQKKNADIPILPITELENFIKTNNIKIAIIAVPDIAAQQILDLLLKTGINGVLNFAPIDLRTSEKCVVNNVNLVSELENTIYFANAMNRKK